MRLPVSKVYRGFPELDRFPDARCEAWVKTAERAHPWSRTAILVFTALCIFPGCVIGAFIVGSIVATVVGRAQSAGAMGAMVAFIALGAATPGILGLMGRDIWLRRAIRTRISDARCLTCRYSLFGLPASAGQVTCPECGGHIVLSDLGLTESDILAPVQESLPV